MVSTILLEIKPTLKLSLQPITKNAYNPMNLSKLVVITCSLREARENTL